MPSRWLSAEPMEFWGLHEGGVHSQGVLHCTYPGILHIDHVNRKVTGLKMEYLYVSGIINSGASLSTENLDSED